MTTKTSPACAIYLRVSLDASGERLAVDRQREDCLHIARDRGWTVVEEYVDNSISASSKTKQRPDYNRMVSDYAAGRFEALICYDLDRLTRQPRQLEDWIDAAEERGLRLVTANGEADLSTDGGRLFARIKASVARAEIERKSARQRRALQQRADKGRPPLGVRLTGYTVKGDVVAAEADLIEGIFARFTAGDSLRGIAEWLNCQPIKTRHGNVWNPSTVRTILLNPRYAGRAVYCGEVTGKLGTWEPIVSEPTFDSAQAILQDPRRITNRLGTDRKYLGAGLYLCGVCGERVRSHSGGRYRCPAGGHVIRSIPPVDAYVEAIICEWLASPDLADVLDAVPSVDSDRHSKEVTRLRQLIGRFERDYDAGLIDGKRFAVATEKAHAELLAAERARTRATASGALSGLLEMRSPAAAFLAAPLGTQRAIVDEYLAVELHPAPRGRKTFDPETVTVTWKSLSD